MAMIIGVDAREAAGRPAGKGRYVQEMLQALPLAMPDVQFKLYVAKQTPNIPLVSNTAWEKVSGAGMWWHFQAARHAKHCDVYFSSTSYLTPQLLRVPYVLMVYDLISFQSFARAQRRAQVIERVTLGRAARRAARIITISQATADDLLQWHPDLRAKTTAIPLAADKRFQAGRSSGELEEVRERLHLPDRFVLCTGTLEPRKNLVRLIEAYTGLPDSLRSGCPLVLAGKWGWQTDEIRQAVERAGDTVHHLDYVDDHDLPLLYAACTLFCYPSLYEGFGLPVLEAMQSGVPVVASNTPAIQEVGGEAIRYVDPYKVDSLRDTLTSVLEDPEGRQESVAAGIRQAQRFSWERTVAETAKVLRRVAS